MITRKTLWAASAIAMSAVVAVSCSPAPPAPPPPPPPAAPTPTPPPPPPEPTGGWQNIPIAPGTWVYREDDRGSVALFGPAEAEATLVVRCNIADRRIYFSRAGTLTDTGSMGFQASAGVRSYPAQNGSGSQPYIVAATSATDPYLDTLSFSRGRFGLTVTGQPRLAIPNWPEMIRVFEDCRR